MIDQAAIDTLTRLANEISFYRADEQPSRAPQPLAAVDYKGDSTVIVPFADHNHAIAFKQAVEREPTLYGRGGGPWCVVQRLEAETDDYERSLTLVLVMAVDLGSTLEPART